MLDAGACAVMTLGPPRVPFSAMLDLRSVLAALGFDRSASPVGEQERSKALPPAPSQCELLPRRDHALSVVEPNARNEILRALAEILLAAAESVGRREERDDEAR
jgi:hypothetical protein